MAYIENVSISDKSLEEIKSAIGWTLLSKELTYLIEDNDIKNYVVAPTLETYYNYFPIISEFSQYCTASSDLPLPYEAPKNTLGVIRQQFVPISSGIPNGDPSTNTFGIYANPWASQSSVYSANGAWPGGAARYGTPYDYGNNNNIYQSKFFQKSLEQVNKAYFIRYDALSNTIYLKSDTSGRFYIQFATFNPSWEDGVILRQRQYAIKYAQGLFLTKMGQVLSLTRSELPSEIDASSLKDEGKEMMDDVLQYWRDVSTIATAR